MEMIMAFQVVIIWLRSTISLSIHQILVPGGCRDLQEPTLSSPLRYSTTIVWMWINPHWAWATSPGRIRFSWACQTQVQMARGRPLMMTSAAWCSDPVHQPLTKVLRSFSQQAENSSRHIRSPVIQAPRLTWDGESLEPRYL